MSLKYSIESDQSFALPISTFQPKYEATVKENAPAGTAVVKVKATDKDDGVFGVVTYQLIGEHSTDFLIDRDSGEITVNHPRVLDREVTPELTIQVMASDGAPPDTRRTAAVPVCIGFILQCLLLVVMTSAFIQYCILR